MMSRAQQRAEQRSERQRQRDVRMRMLAATAGNDLLEAALHIALSVAPALPLFGDDAPAHVKTAQDIAAAHADPDLHEVPVELVLRFIGELVGMDIAPDAREPA